MIVKLVPLLLVCAAPLAATAQVQTQRLSRPNATFAEPFSQIVGLVELSDGRLVIADRLEKAVAVVDLRTGRVTPVGREGSGPGEYQMPGMLFALPGDSSLLIDLGNLRGLIVTPDGRTGPTISFARGEGVAFFPRAADAHGRLYSQQPVVMRGTTPTVPDSAPLLRYDPRSGDIDTVTWLESGASGRGGIMIRTSSGGGFSMRSQPYAPQDAWVVAPDGRVALVRAREYRVEWLATNGTRTTGPVLAYDPVKIGRAEKEEWADQMGSATISMRTPDGARTIRPPRPDVADQDWPATKPPFEGGVTVTPNGDVWIRRSQPAGTRTALYDVVDARGRLTRRVQLPEGRRLVGFGRGTLYAVHRDADDLEWLELYRR